MRALLRYLYDIDESDPSAGGAYVPIGYRSDESTFWDGALVLRVSCYRCFAISKGFAKEMTFQTVKPRCHEDIYVATDER